MSESLSDSISDCTYSFIVDGDIISRMSVEGFEELRDTVLEMIYRIKIAKYKVWKQSKKYDFSSPNSLAQSINDALYDENDTKDCRFKEQVEEFWGFQAELKEANKDDYHKLCLPGTLIQLFRTRSNKRLLRHGNNLVSASCGSSNMSINAEITDTGDSLRADTTRDKSYHYTARWADRTDFQKIVISTHMLLDHDPIGVKTKIQQAASEQLAINHDFMSREDLDDGCE
jgi:hypothetical protein